MPTPLRTRVCDALGIDVPILQAGMSTFTSAELVAAVSNAGGLGILGALLRPVDELRAEIHRIRARTTRPFGVNHVIAHLDPTALDVTFEERVPVLSLAWGDPAPLTARAHAAGVRVVHQVATVADAAQAAAAGVDVIVGQGTDGGATSASSARWRSCPRSSTRRAASRSSPRAGSPTAAASPPRWRSAPTAS